MLIFFINTRFNLACRVYLLREGVISCRQDVSHEGAVLNVLIVTNDVNCIVTWLSGPIAHITGAITLVITLDFSL